jgi:hypothetical protein
LIYLVGPGEYLVNDHGGNKIPLAGGSYQGDSIYFLGTLLGTNMAKLSPKSPKKNQHQKSEIP